MPDAEAVSATPTYDALSDTDRRLVNAYFRNGMVQWKAYADVCYRGRNKRPSNASLRTESSKRFANPNIRAAIAERVEVEAMAADEVLHRLAQQGRNEQMYYLRKDGTIDLDKLIKDGYGHLVKATKYDRKGRLMVEFYDAQAALKSAGQNLGLFKDQVEHSGRLVIVEMDLAGTDPDARGEADA